MTERNEQTEPDDVPASSGGFHAHKPRVLVVDDDAGGARQLAIALELEGLAADTASDAESAVARIEAAARGEAEAAGVIDLVVVELMLPRRNGLELAREVCARFPEVRIVLTGAYHLSERQLARTDCGAIAFVPKPCDAATVAAFLRAKVASAPRDSIAPISATAATANAPPAVAATPKKRPA